eukprot:488551-Pelagomonas_calceolata.AAC.2
MYLQGGAPSLSPPHCICRDGEGEDSMAGLDMLAMEEDVPQDEWQQHLPQDQHNHLHSHRHFQQQQQQQQGQDVHEGSLKCSQGQNTGAASSAAVGNGPLQAQGCPSQLQGSSCDGQDPLSCQDWGSIQGGGEGSLGAGEPLGVEEVDDGFDDEGGVFGVPDVPGRLRAGTGLGVSHQQRLQQRRHRQQQQQQQQQGVDQGMGSSPSPDCLLVSLQVCAVP